MYYVEDVAPRMKDINRYVTWKYAVDWEDISLELNLDYNKIPSIDDYMCTRTGALTEYRPKDNKAKFHDMINFWIKRGVDATWRTLEVALTNVNRRKLGLYPVDDVYGMITHLLYVCKVHLYN